MKKFGSVDEYFDSLEMWKTESEALREVVDTIGLECMLKWSMPVYVYQNKNVVGIFVTKNYFGLWFYQGALLKDKTKLLINAQTGKTKALRQWRMTSKSDIKTRVIKEYILEAMKLVEQGKEIRPNRNQPIQIPQLLMQALSENKIAKASFDKLSKSRRREYAEHISNAKQEKTKLTRLKKILPMIEQGIGLNDQYRR
ncbi:MAG: YdeI/OmpD-associated family protein [Planctomycetota bacterium]